MLGSFCVLTQQVFLHKERNPVWHLLLTKHIVLVVSQRLLQPVLIQQMLDHTAATELHCTCLTRCRKEDTQQGDGMLLRILSDVSVACRQAPRCFMASTTAYFYVRC